MEKTCRNCKFNKLAVNKYPCNSCCQSYQSTTDKFEPQEKKWEPRQGELIEVKQHEYDTWKERIFVCLYMDKAVCQCVDIVSSLTGWSLYHQIKKPIIKYQWVKLGVSGLFETRCTATGISKYMTNEEAANDPDVKEKIEWTRKECSDE